MANYNIPNPLNPTYVGDLDARKNNITTLEQLKNWDVVANPIPNGFSVYIDGANYQYDESNEVSETTGKFAVFAGGGGIEDAPTDGKTYGRNSAKWVEVTSGSGDIPDNSIAEEKLDAEVKSKLNKTFKTINGQNIEGSGDLSVIALEGKTLTNGDNINMTEEGVVSAKSTNNLTFTRIVTSEDYIEGVIKTNGAVGDIVDVTNIISSAEYYHHILGVTKGQILRFGGRGESVGRLWCVTDTNYVMLNKSGSNLNIVNNPQTITIEEDGYFITNSNVKYYAGYTFIELVDAASTLSTVSDVLGGENSTSKLNRDLYTNQGAFGRGVNLIPPLWSNPFKAITSNCQIINNKFKASNVTSNAYISLANTSMLNKYIDITDSFIYYAVLNITSLSDDAVGEYIRLFAIGSPNIYKQITITGTGVVYIKLELTSDYLNNLSLYCGYNNGFTSLEFDILNIGIVPSDIWSDSLFSKLQYGEISAASATSIIPDSSFETYSLNADRLTSITDSLVGLYSNLSNVQNYAIVRNGAKIELTGSVVSPYALQYWGFDANPSGYATEEKTYAIIFKGTYTGTNTQSVQLGGSISSTPKALVAQDVEDNVPVNFEVLHKMTYKVGQSTNDRYIIFKANPKVNTEPISIKYEIEEFFVQEVVEGWSINDYIENKYEQKLIPINLPSTTATKDYVNNEVTTLKNTLLSEISPYSISYGYDVNMLINFGQSLSVGEGASDALTDFRKTLSFDGGCNEWANNLDINNATQVAAFYGDSFKYLNDVITGYPPVVTNAVAWMSTLEKENNVDLDDFEYQFILSTPGLSGSSITLFAKGTDTYNRLLFSVEKAFNHSAVDNKTFGVPCLFWCQGEADKDWTQEAYYNAMVQLFTDLNTDIKAITKQVEDVQFITYQMSSTYQDAPDGFHNSGATFAQLQAAIEVDNIHLGGAMYQFVYGDQYHPSDRAVVGLQAGIVAKKIINDKKPYELFYPKTHRIQNNGDKWLLSIEYGVPVKPMRFDISGDKWHNPNGKQPNFGFTLLNTSGVDIIASEPIIRRGNTLIIECSENPTNAKLNYALNGHYGGGNLCDSQNAIVQNKGIDYVIDNFAPTFKDYVI